MRRYFALLWDSCSLENARAYQSWRAAAASKLAEWTVACEAPGMLVLHAGPRRGATDIHPLSNGSGVVLGRLFSLSASNGSTSPVQTFDEDETQRILASAGQHVVDHYWGAYVAIVNDAARHRHHVFQDPIGNMPCYRARFRGLEIIFSHIEDCLRLLPVSFSINHRYLARMLVHWVLTGTETGLDNVEKLPRGQRLTLCQGRTERALLWDPIAIASTPRIQQPEEAAVELRTTVQNTIDAWASCFQRIVLKLSGGFDSSVVAGCLAQARSKPEVSYLHMWIDMELDEGRVHLPGMDQRTANKLRAIAGHGDQRYFARLVAERWRTPMTERQRSLSVDLSRLWHVPLRVTPALYYTKMHSDDAEAELARTMGAEAIFSGQAGDSVFLATQQPLPAIDHAYQHGLGPALWQHLHATSRLSGDSLWSVLGKAIRHGALRRPYGSAFNALALPTLLSPQLLETLTVEDFQGELMRRVANSNLPPGKRDHVKGVAWSEFYDFVFYSGRYAEHIDPLNSQPVWELMLQIPTWTVLTGGVSRGLARRAFSDLLPEEIRKRLSKGSGAPYYQHLVRANKDFMRERLLDGLLVQRGYLDRRLVDQCFSSADPGMTVSAVTLLNYLSAEIWLQQWTGQQASSNATTMRQGATS